MQSNLTRLLQKSSVLMGARLVGGVLAFAVNIIIARWFGADVLGQFALAMAVASLVAVFLPTGLQSIAMLFVSRYVAEQKTGDARAFLEAGYYRVGLLSVLGGGAFAIGFALFRDQFEEHTFLTAGIAFLTAPALALLNFNCGVLTGLKQQMLGLLPDLVVKPALMFIAVLALATSASSSNSPFHVMLVVCVCMWVTAIGQIFAMRRTIQLPASGSNPTEKKRWQEASLPWIAITLMWDYLIELHLLMAGMLLAPGKVGLLHICFKLRVLAAFGVRALYSMVMPEVFAADATSKTKELEHGIARVNFLTLAYALLVFTAVASLGELILSLVKPDFSSGYYLLLLICASILPRAVFGPCTAMLSMRGYQKTVAWIIAVCLGLSLVQCLVFVPEYGVTGVAIAYLVSTSLASFVQWQWAKRVIGIDCSIFASLRLHMQVAEGRSASTSTLARVLLRLFPRLAG